jgi:hypothetical protein
LKNLKKRRKIMYSWSKDWPTLTEAFFGKEDSDINQEAQDEILSSTGKIVHPPEDVLDELEEAST